MTEFEMHSIIGSDFHSLPCKRPMCDEWKAIRIEPSYGHTPVEIGIDSSHNAFVITVAHSDFLCSNMISEVSVLGYQTRIVASHSNA